TQPASVTFCPMCERRSSPQVWVFIISECSFVHKFSYYYNAESQFFKSGLGGCGETLPILPIAWR
ncbi:MAG: hypothetical protein ACUVWB_13355, partial [Anaerolineae bacterium]